jgi:hypothetical protein
VTRNVLIQLESVQASQAAEMIMTNDDDRHYDGIVDVMMVG